MLKLEKRWFFRWGPQYDRVRAYARAARVCLVDPEAARQAYPAAAAGGAELPHSS